VADYSRPWREFNNITAGICEKFGSASPFGDASIVSGIERIKTQLAAGSTLLFTYASNKGCEFFFVHGGRYQRETIAIDSLQLFCKALAEYQKGGGASRAIFRKRLGELETAISPIMGRIVTTLENNNSSRFVFIPDMLTEGLPIFPAIIASEKLRLRIKDGQFEFLTCPALWEEQGDCIVGKSGLFLSNSEEKLELTESERILVQSAFPPGCCLAHDLNSDVLDFSKPPVNSTGHIHLATHSVPANSFTDPNFVSTSLNMGKNSIWLDSVQRESPKLQFKLVVLNGCNTGTTSNWNLYGKFMTNEKVGLSSVFLLNRRSVVIATQWNEPEIASFTFTSLFYRNLKAQRHGAKAFALAMVDLFELDIEGAVKVFQGILSESLRQDRCKAIAKSASPYPFRSAYSLGMFQCHSLMFK